MEDPQKTKERKERTKREKKDIFSHERKVKIQRDAERKSWGIPKRK